MSYRGLEGWMETETFDGLREAALSHVWFPFQQLNDVAAEGGLQIMTEGKGAKIKDIHGKEYYDGFAGLALVNVGYGREEIARAVYEQMSTLHYANTFAYATIPAIKAAEKLASLAPGDLNRVFFTSGGSDSVETAMKMARQYHFNRGDKERVKFISRRGSYHGVSLGALAVNMAPWVNRDIFEPMLPIVRVAPQPSPYRCELGGETASECAVLCAEAVEKIILEEGPETVVAVIAEPVSVSSGVAIPGPEYWPMLRDICDRHGVLLIADEVINGFGRTGKMFAIEHFGVQPDIITVAKGITSGYQPVGACIVRDQVAEAFVGGEDVTFRHGYTYSGHPAGAAAALVNMEIIERGGPGGELGSDGPTSVGPADGFEGASHSGRRARAGPDVRRGTGEGQGNEGVPFVGARSGREALSPTGGERSVDSHRTISESDTRTDAFRPGSGRDSGHCERRH